MFIKRFSLVLMIFSAMAIHPATTEAQVQSKSFQLMLDLMLSSKTPTISVKQAKLHAGSYLFLDAREPEEYAVSHIANAKFVGYDNFDLNRVNNVAKNLPIVVYCSVGKRSENITNKLKDAGFANVKNLYGGIFEWVNEGNRVYDSNNVAVNKVHAYNHIWGMWLQKGEKVY